jgi:error-prone DNA polymerase
MGYDRRRALWEVSSRDYPKSLFSTLPKEASEEQIELPEMKLSEHVIYDYATTSLSIKAHPVSFVRGKLQQLHVLSASHLINIEHEEL